MFRLMVFLSIVAVMLSCAKKEESKQEEVVTGETYQATGQVVSVQKSDSVIVVNHSAIPGFMGAMTMGFRVKDLSLLKNLQASDSIKFNITVGGGEMYISKIEKIE